MNRALLVDDDPAHRLMARRALLKARPEFTVIEAESLAAGIAAFDSGSFELVIVDLNLAGASGVELIRFVRAKNLSVALIAISTSSLERDIAATYEAGADVFVSKAERDRSFPADLAAAVEFLLKR